MKLTFLGTCSGTEPHPERKHCSFAIERDGGLYWFDCGEGCSHTAHVMGLDLMATRAIFISHTHMDHIGGLANLLWNIRKLTTLGGGGYERTAGRHIDVLIPNLEVWNGIRQVLAGTEGGFEINFFFDAREYADGVIFDDGKLKVSAAHNRHLGTPRASEPWRAFSFRIESAGRAIVYSGDVGEIGELAGLLDGCDLLLMETGHHGVEDVCRYVRDCGRRIGKLGFHHHGREILDYPAESRAKAHKILGERVFFADDKMELQI